MSDDVTLEIAGRAFGGWESLTIERTLDSVADAFAVQAPFDPDQPEIRAAFKPFGYHAVSVKIDGELVLTGRVESVSPTTTAGDRAISVQGRSLTGALVDCAVDGIGYQFDGLTLAAIARRVCAPFGLAVDAKRDSAAFTEARAQPGDTAFWFLNRLAQDAGLLLTCDTVGRLVVTKVTPGAAPVAALIEGTGPLREASAVYDGTRRFSLYRVLQQQDGEPDIVGTADDSGVGVYRPTVDTGAEGDAKNVTAAAAWRRALGLAEAVGVDVTVSGWRSRSGAIWVPGNTVTLDAPGAYVLRETPFVVAAVRLTLDAQDGRTTALRLVLPATYTGEMPGAYPWA